MPVSKDSQLHHEIETMLVPGIKDSQLQPVVDTMLVPGSKDSSSHVWWTQC